MRGPIGRYFVWQDHMGGPLLMVAGGSGVVPFRSMLRHRNATGSEAPARLLYSARSLAEVVYHEELAGVSDGVEVRLALTRDQPLDWDGYGRRIDAAILAETAWAPQDRPLIYVCGPTGFVEAAANCLVDLGHDPESIKTERFGPTG